MNNILEKQGPGAKVAILLVYYLLLEIVSISNSYYSLLLIFVFVLAMFLYERLYGITSIILLFFLSDDLDRVVGSDIYPIISIYVTPFVVISLIALILFFSIIKTKNNISKNLFRFSISQVILILVSVLIGIEYVMEFPRQAVHDISYFLIPLTMAYFITLIYNSEDKLKLLLYAIIVSISIKYIYLFILFLAGHGSLAGHLVQVVFDTGKKIVPIFTVYFFLLARNYRELGASPLVSFLFKFMVVVTIMLSVSIASRSTLAFLILMMLVALYFDTNGILRYVKNLTYLTLIIISIIVIISIIQPDSINYILWKMRSALEIDLEADKFSSTSAIVRYVSLLNIFYQHLSEGTLAFGAGAASYFNDSYVHFPFSIYNKSAFPDEWINNGTLFKPHTTPIFLFLKVGLIGTIFYFWSYWKVFSSARNKLNLINDNFLRISCIVLMVSLLILTVNNFSSKLQIIAGIVVGIIISIISLPAKNSNKSIL